MKNLRSGFTLIEMLLYVSICSFLLLSLSLFVTFLLGSRVKNQVIADVNQQGSQVMQLITQTVRNAKTVDTPSVGVTSSSLSLTVDDPLLSPTLFDVNGGIVRIKEGSGANILLTNSHVTVSSIVFKNVSSTSSPEQIIQINFTLDYKNQSGRDEYSFGKNFSGSVTLRQ